MKTIGSRIEVWNGLAKKTSGGLLKKDLKKNKRGKIVSKKMSNRAKKEKRLEKAGYKTKKGKFTLFKKKKGGGKKERDEFFEFYKLIAEEMRKIIFPVNKNGKRKLNLQGRKINRRNSIITEINDIINNVKSRLNGNLSKEQEVFIRDVVKWYGYNYKKKALSMLQSGRPKDQRKSFEDFLKQIYSNCCDKGEKKGFFRASKKHPYLCCNEPLCGPINSLYNSKEKCEQIDRPPGSPPPQPSGPPRNPIPSLSLETPLNIIKKTNNSNLVKEVKEISEPISKNNKEEEEYMYSLFTNFTNEYSKVISNLKKKNQLKNKEKNLNAINNKYTKLSKKFTNKNKSINPVSLEKQLNSLKNNLKLIQLNNSSNLK